MLRDVTIGLYIDLRWAKY